MQCFWGTCNFYRRFLQATAQHSQPLYKVSQSLEAVACHAGNLQAGQNCSHCCISLSHAVLGAVLSHAMEAMGCHNSSVLQQQAKGHWHPLEFFSKKLSTIEVKYSTFDRELPACH
jgi:hypothetical protein